MRGESFPIFCTVTCTSTPSKDKVYTFTWDVVKGFLEGLRDLHSHEHGTCVGKGCRKFNKGLNL